MDRKGYHLELLPDEPIILLVCTKEYSLRNDWHKIDQENVALLDTANEPLFLITDATEASLSLEDLILGANAGARGGVESLDQTREVPGFKHPKLKEMIYVTTNKLLKLALKGMDSLAFGNIKVAIFDTREEALAYCRAKIAAR